MNVNLLRHLEYFVAVADARHFGHAAADLGMTQPPLSQGVQRLERRWGAQLFERSAQGVQVTDAGAQLLPLARQIVAEAERLDGVAHELTAHSPAIEVGFGASLGGVGARVVARVRQTFGRPVTPHELASVDAVDRVRRGLLDVAVVRHPSVIDGTDASDVVRLAQWLVVPDGLGSELRQLDVPLAGPPRAHHPPAHDQVVDVLRRHGHPGTFITEPSPAAAVALVAAGRACTFTLDAVAPSGTRLVAPPPELAVLRLRVVAPSPAHRRPHVPRLRETVEEALT